MTRNSCGPQADTAEPKSIFELISPLQIPCKCYCTSKFGPHTKAPCTMQETGLDIYHQETWCYNNSPGLFSIDLDIVFTGTYGPEYIQQQPWTLLYRPGQIHPKDPVPCKKQSWTLLYRPGHIHPRTWYNIRNSPGPFTTDLDIVFRGTWTDTTTALDPSIQTWSLYSEAPGQIPQQPWIFQYRPGQYTPKDLVQYKKQSWTYHTKKFLTI